MRAVVLFYLLFAACYIVNTVQAFLGAVLAGAGVAIAGCLAGLWCSKGKGKRDPPDTTPPKFVPGSCPADIHTEAQENRRGALVYWVPPKAKDSQSGVQRVIPMGPVSGSFFTAGDYSHTIQYSAIDRAGNMVPEDKSCKFKIQVQQIVCPELDVALGYLQCGHNGLIYGTECRLNCFPGYEIDGDRISKCGHNGQWSPTVGSCARVQCNSLEPRQHSRKTCDADGGECSFKCDQGYSIRRGDSSTLLCMYNGRWSGTVPECEDTSRPQLECPSDIRTQVDKGFDTTVVNWTIPIATDNERISRLDKKTSWPNRGARVTGGTYQVIYEAADDAQNIATCSFMIFVADIECDINLLFTDWTQRVTCSNQNKLGSVCEYHCRKGYTMEEGESEVLECLQPDSSSNSIGTGVWSAPRPNCSPVECEPLNAPLNGSLSSSCGFSHGEFCRIDCDEGFEIKGIASIRCVDGVWDGEPASCEARTCPLPYVPYKSRILNTGVCHATGTAAVGTNCSYECNLGFFLVGNAFLTCDENGRWFPREPPRCNAITCDGNEVQAPPNGYRSGCFNGDLIVGTECTLGCNHGFIARPDSVLTVTCIKDENNPRGRGIWDPNTTLSCDPVECIPFPNPPNGFISGCRKGDEVVKVNSTQSYGSTCTAECNDGYTPYGTSARSCMITGGWAGQALTCLDDTPPKVQCPGPKIQIAEPLRTSVTMDFEWEPLKVFDVSPWVKSLKMINFQPVNTSDIPTVFEEGEYLMHYAVVDAMGNEALCPFDYAVKVLRCPALYAPQYGIVELVQRGGTCGNAVRGALCRLTCEEGYHLSNDQEENIFTCVVDDTSTSKGYWNGARVTCAPNVCNVPDFANGFISGCIISGTDQVDYQTTCQFACALGFYSSDGGRSVVRRTCQADGSWSGTNLICTAVTCPGYFHLQDGDIQPLACITDEHLPYGTVCRFSCKSGYQHNGPFTKRCGRNGHWEGENRNTACIDTEAPTFTTRCPQYIQEYADRGVSATVNYEDINATDNAGDDQVRISRNPLDVPENGGTFPEGYHTITYRAEDKRGNFAECKVYISVLVPRCPVLSSPISGSKSCSGRTKGSTCEFTCNEGYEIDGQSHILTCSGEGSTAQWNYEPPSCTPVQCPPLPDLPVAIKPGCRRRYYGDACLWACPYGYENIGNPKWSCQADHRWSEDNFTCAERTCPSINFGSDFIVAPPGCGENPSFEDTCHVRCAKKRYHVFPRTHSYMRCRGNGRWTYDVNEIECRDEEPPRLVCPLHFIAYAEEGEYGSLVPWNVTAEDNSGEEIEVVCNRESGYYPEGSYDVLCSATDSGGNRGSCTFEFHVRVRYCPPFILPPSGAFKGQCSSHYGSICELTCSEGYELQGSPTATCEREGERMVWKTEHTPRCAVSSCPPIPADVIPADIGVTPAFCQDKKPPVYGLECRFYCKKYGFRPVRDFPPITCESDGTWSVDLNTISFQCEDVLPPDVYNCPSNIFASISEGSTDVEVNFQEPNATDNSELAPLVIRSPRDVTSPYRVSESITVTFTFCDSFDNSRSCSFHIEVQNDLPPEVVSCPADKQIEATGRDTEVTWDDPVFSEPLGDNEALTQSCNYNSGTSLPWGSHNIVCTAVNTKNNRIARCEFVVEVRPRDCRPLRPPRNGALACDEWVYGHFCNQQCNDQYDVPPGIYQPYFICGTSGLWSPSIVLDCTLPRRTDSFHLSSSIQYFSGDCRNPDTQRAIQEAFIEMLDGHEQLSDICSGSSQCTADRVSVKCGLARRSPRGRGKRHIDMKKLQPRDWSDDMNYKDFLLKQKAEDFMKENQKQTPLSKLREDRNNELNRQKSLKQPRRRRRSIDDYVITISFDVVAYLNASDNSTDYEYEDSVYDAMYSLYDVAAVIEEEAWAGNLVPEVPDLDLNINENASFAYEDPVPTCPSGYGIVWTTYSCAACVAGTYFDEEYGDCIACPIGEYQDTEAQTACKICPPGTTTEDESSRSVDECLAYCVPGEYSATGLEPCAKCEVGFYQPLKQMKSCDSCPPGHTTLTNGSSSVSQCIELCPPGYWSSDGFQPCQQCRVRYFQPKYGQSGCLPCPGTKTTDVEGASSEDDCRIEAACAEDDCYNDASCESFIDGPRCTCPDGYTGDRCETNIIDCKDTSCANGGTCIDLVNDYSCICKDGYEGDDCSEDIDECSSSPCIHAVSCVDLVADFACICMEGYTNKTCNEELRPCESEPCQNGGTCQSIFSQFNCTCIPGYSGDYCEVEINECQSNPCLNGGTCNDLLNGYDCDCINGYSGVVCEEDEDLCNPNPCLNDGLCVEEDDNYICVCPLDKAGLHCERDATPCDSKPCISGTCHELDQSDSKTGIGYHCECDVGFSGINCDIPVSACESFPCSNNGTCESTADGYVCHCMSSFTGEHCERVYDPCSEGPCQNNGICVQDEESFFCICTPEFSGIRCQDQVSLCLDDFCQNGGYCSPTNSSYVCGCPSGFKGVACEKQIDMCESQPCLNDGKCIPGNTTFSCQCREGYTGEICDTNIDDCLDEPCIHGICEDMVANYTCECFPGFEGTDCDIDVNDCVGHTCVYGECVDGNSTYSCLCEPGYRGRYCQEEIDECASDPCFHSGSCVNQVNAYQCLCEEGWVGDRCQINYDDCIPGVCLNGGTCVDRLNDFTCLCVSGFSGERCEININECDSSPCENDGFCHDGDDGYTCSCQRGWSGENCQIRIGMCQPNPCLHGGICNTTHNAKGYTCQCQPGLIGEHCEKDVDDCVDNDCDDAATCLDLRNGYKCICPPGFIGETCSIQDDPCEATPCLNNGTCNRKTDKDTKIPCLCPPGYEGQYCERDLDDCIPDPCLNGGECIDGLNTFTCQCKPGLSGDRCQENIDECQNHSCEEIGTLRCQDEVDGYACICRHGFKGRYCTERMSSDFDIVFPRDSTNSYIQLPVPRRRLRSFTLSMWVRSENREGNILSYELATGGGVYVFIDDVLKVQFLGSTIATSAIITGNRWYHIAATYSHYTSTITVFADGDTVATQQLPQEDNTLESPGIVTLGKINSSDFLDLGKFAGHISSVNIWDEVKTAREISSLSEWCFVEIPGNLLVLADFNAGVIGDVKFEQPSNCEAFDDCAINPCANGSTCIDGYQKFECLCPKGLEGLTCSENPDDCIENACLNGGTCVDGYDVFTCICTPEYTGNFCELNVVDGGWSEWSEWSECTETCGGGNQTARRKCNSPRPQNGGTDCGDASQSIRTQGCNTHECPHCRDFVGPRNGFLQQVSGSSSQWEIKYQVFCKEGFDFCRQPFYEYFCGPETGYIWNHEIGNPKLRVPGCSRKRNVKGIQLNMSGKYSGDICRDRDRAKQESVVKKVNQVTSSNGQRQRCVRSGICKLSIKAQACSGNEGSTGRSRREVEQPSATVTMKFTQLVNYSVQEYLDTVAPDSEPDNNSATVGEAFTEVLADMSEVFESMVTSVQSGLFRISSEGELYDMELVDSYATFVCDEGSVLKFNTTTCVTCEPGTYQSENLCIPCDLGTYQPKEGKTSCKVCPNEDGVNWTGFAAVERTECFPPSNFS